MAVITLPHDQGQLKKPKKIHEFLHSRGILYENWPSPGTEVSKEPESILRAYDKPLNLLMEKGGYQSADIIAVNEKTPNIQTLNSQFFKEHTHTEDEVRFFAEGSGRFWFNQNSEVFSVLCQKGDLIGVPAQYRHWFDLGARPLVVAIRIFTNPTGWVAQYTNSGLEKSYQSTSTQERSI